jgi:hypothetical protein
MTKPNYPYYMVEDFIDKEYCDQLAKYFKDNAQEDSRQYYKTYGIDGKKYFFAGYLPKAKDYDPEMKIYEAVHFAYDFFTKNYDIAGNFELNRVSANLMFEESELNPHHDDRAGTTPLSEIGSRTYVCGIFLTDDYEGGEITFEEHDVSFKPKAGSLLMFPGFSSRHGVNKIVSGLRLNILVNFFDVIDRNKVNPDYPAY